jgi:hypothetical protein
MTVAVVVMLINFAMASSLIINFNDGSTVSYDTSKIMSMMYSDSQSLQGPAQESVGNVLFEEHFNGALADMWEPVSAAGGDYKRFGKVIGGKLEVSVPPNNSWGKSGIMSKDPFLTVDKSMETKPLKIVFDFNPAKTTGYVIALSTAKNADIWVNSNVWFYWIKTSALNGSTAMVDTQGAAETNSGGFTTRGTAPKSITMTIYPERVDVLESDGTQLSSKKLTQLKVGNSVYLYIFSHPAKQHDSSAFSLDSIKVLR